MDPLTATITFLCTPVGQKVAQLLLDINTKIITDIFTAFHATLPSSAPKVGVVDDISRLAQSGE